jgi:divalent metal cation (Fe/Co/Zn/Cd) transporter
MNRPKDTAAGNHRANSPPDLGRDASCCSPCVSPPLLPRPVAWLQAITLVWMLLECTAALIAAARAHSVALLAFGADSLVELLSAIVVLLQFLPQFPLKRAHADRAAAVLLFALAFAVVGIAIPSWHAPVETSPLGMAVTALALAVMPVLARLKRRQARTLDNRALAADAMQSATCAYLAAVTLAGLAINALWRIAWVDTVAALAAVPILIVEGRRAWRGESCGCA